jgi:integration host factor subunit alpha
MEKISTKTGFSRKKAAETIETALKIMKETLASGEDILARGFGKFSVHNKSERKGRNPATGKEMVMPERKVVTFKSSGKLRGTINKK